MTAIETKKLTKRFKEKTAVNEIDIEIKQGELFALLGVNGAGKTTTIKMLSGLILPTSGEIVIENMNMKNIISSIIIGLEIATLIMAIILWVNTVARSICLLLAPLFNLILLLINWRK